MKSSLLNLALVTVTGLALCAPVAVQAQTNAVNNIATSPVKNPEPASSTTTSSKKMAKTPYKGTVKSIDTAANSIVVTGAKGDMTLAVNSMTKVNNDKKPATLADITMGEKVTGSFTKDSAGMMTACSIHGHTK